ncbi:OmpP1/FadL family transporter [Immundisolibacter sp.]|uniref:OmpP1/FadL family transporter n=1 Tax=Immundisolibacter sp. TaxID=1934948 RepID=UPI003F87CEB2
MSIRKGLWRGLALAFAVASTGAAQAAGGYFAMGYGPVARQMAGATTAVTGDAFAGASNPGKLVFAGDRLDLGVELFMPSRRIERSGSGTPYDFHSVSRNSLFLIPEGAYSRQLNDRLAWGITVYGNGGLNTEYTDTTGVPGSNGNPAACGAAAGNFLLGCGKLGFDLTQLVVAPTLAWRPTPRQGLGIAPLITAQRFKAYGLQAFAPLSEHPGRVTNRGYDIAFGLGLRIGWYAQPTPWLSLGAAYATRTFMQKFDKYEGLFAEGTFDVPENFNVGVALRPTADWLVSLDVQRINFAGVNSLGNGVLNTLTDPAGRPLGSAQGSGFNWRDANTYRIGIAYSWSPRLTLRAGYGYGARPNDDDINTVSFNMLTPNQLRQASVGFSWQLSEDHELHGSAGHYFESTYRGPSAALPGATEKIRPHVEMLMLAWSWRL